MAISAIRFDRVSRHFPGVVALRDVSFEIAEGSCHALCGENGAGKSTLGKILAGILSPDSGSFELFGKPARFRTPADARAAGVAIVHQELAFAEGLTVAENLCLGDLPVRGLFVRFSQMADRARRLLETIHVHIDVDCPLGELSISQQQLVQIASAVGTGAKVIVFDEPTSSLSQSEAEDIVALCGRLRARGVTVLYVTHRVEEIFKLCDAVTVLRDGRHVLTSPTGELDEPALVRAMIGRTLESHSPRYLERPPGEELLRVENLFSPRKFRHISFSIHAGEVLGMAGLIGAGRTEIARAIFGLDAAATGRVFLRGQPMVFKQPASAMQAGIGLVPEDRKRHGLVLGLSCKENLSLPMLNTRGLSRAGFVRLSAESALVQRYFERFRVKTPHPNFVVAGLSGGNQQKIVLAKWLAAECRLLLLDEPTRGIDVGAKAEIHEFVDQLVQRGAGVLLISSELPEVLKLSRRILVLCRGQIADELSRDQATQESILRLMSAQPA